LTFIRAATRLILPVAVAASTLCGCVTPPLEPRTVLDENSGASITVVDQPLIMARERRDVAVQARDYLTFVAAEVDESGHRQLVWVVHQWSTIDERAAEFRPAPDSPLLVVADGRDLRLKPIGDSMALRYIHNAALGAPEDAHAVTTAYAVDPATLDFVAASRQLSVAFPESRLTLPFGIWKDGRAALQRLLDQVGR
jgi:hypothetical protein